MKNLTVLTFVCFVVLCSRSANAQTFVDRPQDVEPSATACAYTFTSGAGAKQFTWCLTVNGNVTKIETPAGQNHQPGAAEGYSICSAAGVHGHDHADVISVPLGPPTVLAGCISGSSCTIQRDTLDGVFRLIQKFTQNPKERELNIDHTLINLSGATVNNVVLTRMTAMGPNNDWGDDRGDRSPRSAWLTDADSLSSTASTMTEAVDTFIVAGWPAGCNPLSVATPAPPGIYANQLNYRLGNIASLKKKIVRVQLRVQ